MISKTELISLHQRRLKPLTEDLKRLATVIFRWSSRVVCFRTVTQQRWWDGLRRCRERGVREDRWESDGRRKKRRGLILGRV